jgi:hypothetical protein
MIILEPKYFPYIQRVIKGKLPCMISNNTSVNLTSSQNITGNALCDVLIIGKLFRAYIYNARV